MTWILLLIRVESARIVVRFRGIGVKSQASQMRRVCGLVVKSIVANIRSYVAASMGPGFDSRRTQRLILFFGFSFNSSKQRYFTSRFLKHFFSC